MKKLMRLWWVLGVLLFLITLQTASAFYDPAPQRWINRDPIEERGGVNLYSFLFNNPPVYIDAFGLEHMNAYPYVTPISWGEGQFLEYTNYWNMEQGNEPPPFSASSGPTFVCNQTFALDPTIWQTQIYIQPAPPPPKPTGPPIIHPNDIPCSTCVINVPIARKV